MSTDNAELPVFSFTGLEKTAPKNLNVMLKPEELAGWLRIHRRTVLKAIEDGSIPAIKLTGRTWRIHAQTFLDRCNK